MDSFTLFPTLKTSAFPLSIGTSQALESLFPGRDAPYDPERKIPNRVDVTKYDYCYFNLATLYRNFMGSLEKEDVLGATGEKMAYALLTELDVIQDLFSIEGNNLCKPVFYSSQYKKLNATPTQHFALRKASTPQQIHYESVYLHALENLDKLTDSLVTFDDAITADRYPKAIAVTHHPYDLIQFKQFDRLELLESNTGVLKPRAMWGSKYYPVPGENMLNLPFHRPLLKVFGDTSQIKPFPLKARKTILEIAKKRDWNGLTTIDRVNSTLDMDMADLYLRSVIKSM